MGIKQELQWVLRTNKNCIGLLFNEMLITNVLNSIETTLCKKNTNTND